MCRNLRKPTYQKELLEYVLGQIKNGRNFVEVWQLRLAWQTENEVSGSKSTLKAKLKAVRWKERLQKWKEDFKNLLRNPPPEITDKPTEKIINCHLDVKLGQFVEEELENKKNQKRKICHPRWSITWSMENKKIWQHTSSTLLSCVQINTIEKWTKDCILPFSKKGDLGTT